VRALGPPPAPWSRSPAGCRRPPRSSTCGW
jgi:hypothetical protein